MPRDIWTRIHSEYREKDWIDKPSLFVETAIGYFPKSGKILDLGAGQGQDSRFFAEREYRVVSTDISDKALELSRAKTPESLNERISIQKLDLSLPFSFPDETFDAVYAHLSLHYFDKATTKKIFGEIKRVLKKSGILSFLVNSTSDPEYGTGEKIEEGFFEVGGLSKRYFSVETVKELVSGFNVILLDNLGETYKDRVKGVHNLIRFIGKKGD